MMRISAYITKIAFNMLANEVPLDVKELRLLASKGPELIRKVKEKKKKALKEMSLKDKRLLLAYVVYLRQNLTTQTEDHPNFEDAAKILHKEILSEKENKITDALEKQLSKAGIDLD